DKTGCADLRCHLSEERGRGVAVRHPLDTNIEGLQPRREVGHLNGHHFGDDGVVHNRHDSLPAIPIVRLVVWRLTTGAGRLGYSIAPKIQGLNSSWPTPASSLFVRLPEATARISSKISLPSSSRVTPSSTFPALLSMSGSWRA